MYNDHHALILCETEFHLTLEQGSAVTCQASDEDYKYVVRYD